MFFKCESIVFSTHSPYGLPLQFGWFCCCNVFLVSPTPLACVYFPICVETEMMLVSQMPSRLWLLSTMQFCSPSPDSVQEYRAHGSQTRMFGSDVEGVGFFKVRWGVFNIVSYRLIGEKCHNCQKTSRQTQHCLACLCGQSAVRHKSKGVNSSVCGTTSLFLPDPKTRQHLNLEDLTGVEKIDKGQREWLCAVKIK